MRKQVEEYINESLLRLETAGKALTAGFPPDIISTDLTLDKFNIPPYAENLLNVMAKYMTLGMEGRIGTLRPGAYADLVILKQKHVNFVQRDFKDGELASDTLLVPQLTMCRGEIDFCQTDFFL